MTQSFPVPGTDRLGDKDVGGAVRQIEVVLGVTSAADVVVTDAATYDLISLKSGTIVLDILAETTERWEDSLPDSDNDSDNLGAAATIKVGDSDDDDGFFTDTLLVPQTAVTTGIQKSLSTAAYGAGIRMNADKTIKAVVEGTPGTGFTAGRTVFTFILLDP